MAPGNAQPSQLAEVSLRICLDTASKPPALVNLPLWQPLGSARCGRPRRNISVRATVVGKAGERSQELLRGGKQDLKGDVTFDAGEPLRVAALRGGSVRFEVFGWSGSPLAMAEILTEDLMRKEVWSLLLCHPGNREAVYGTDVTWADPVQVRRPCFLRIRAREEDAARATLTQDLVPMERSVEDTAAKAPLSGFDSASQGSTLASSKEGERKAVSRAMILTRGTRGDVQPFIALARGLSIHHGCEVTICTEITWKQLIKESSGGLPVPVHFRPSGGDTPRRLSGGVSRQAIITGAYVNVLQSIMLAASEVEFFFSEGCFYHWAKEERPDFIIFNTWTAHIAMIISEALKIPIVGFPLQPVRYLEPTFNPYSICEDVMLPIRKVLAGPSFNYMLAQVMDRVPRAHTINELRLSRGLGAFPKDIDFTNKEEEELRFQCVPRIVPISPLAIGEEKAAQMKGVTLTDFIFLRVERQAVEVQEQFKEIDDFIAQARQARRPVVCITFSSMPVGERLMLKLAVEICNQCDLQDGRRRPTVILMLTGQPRERSPNQAAIKLEKAKRLLILRRPVPFEILFPKLDTVILHGGLGVTSEAMIAGIPIITSGILLFDQRYWAARAAELGIGSAGVTMKRLFSSAKVGSQSLAVELMKQALLRNPDGNGGGNWASNAQELKQKLEAASLGDADGIKRNAKAVFDAGTKTRAIVANAYSRKRGCCQSSARQSLCCCTCLGQSGRWLLVTLLPACLLLWLHWIIWCVLCRPCVWVCCSACPKKEPPDEQDDMELQRQGA